MSIDAKIGKPHLEFFRIGEDGWSEIAPGIRQKILAGGLDERGDAVSAEHDA